MTPHVTSTKIYLLMLFLKWNICSTQSIKLHTQIRKVQEEFYKCTSTHRHTQMEEPIRVLILSFKNCAKLFLFLLFFFGVLEALSLFLLRRNLISSIFSCQVEDRWWIKFELICRGVWKAFEKLLVITMLQNWVMRSKSHKTALLSFG